MYDGYVETPAQIQARFDRIKANMAQRKAAVNQPITTREYLKRLAEHGNTVISPEVMTIQDVLMLYEQLDNLRDSLRDANEGAKLLHSVAMNGEQSVLSRLDNGVDAVEAQRWQDEAIAQEADAKDWQDQVTDLRAGG